MGVTNFTKLLEPFFPPSKLEKAKSFDSILVDAQGLLYIAIEYAIKTEESAFFKEVCDNVAFRLGSILVELFSTRQFEAFVTVIISFDGEGVPMKWPTQRERRKNKRSSRKSLYRCALFGNNVLSARVGNHLRSLIASGSFLGKEQTPSHMQYVVSGCDVPGEGEHKIFEIAERLECRRVVVVSADNDVFILSLLRIDRYDRIQVFRKGKYYDITWFAQTALPYPKERLIAASLLFGNDFVPCLVAITPANVTDLHDALCKNIPGDETWPRIVASFLKTIRGKIKFQDTPSLDRQKMIEFWKVCFWIQDYYTVRQFPQKNMHNSVFEEFDRNALLTALSNVEYSAEIFCEARKSYEKLMVDESNKNSFIQVFDEEVLKEIKRLFICAGSYDGTIETITLSAKRSRPLTRST